MIYHSSGSSGGSGAPGQRRPGLVWRAASWAGWGAVAAAAAAATVWSFIHSCSFSYVIYISLYLIKYAI